MCINNIVFYCVFPSSLILIKRLNTNNSNLTFLPFMSFGNLKYFKCK